MSDQVHKNLKLLKGIPEDEFMDTMGFFSAALGVGCEFCHGSDSIGNWQGFAGETPMKETARKMMRMVDQINKNNFGGQRLLTCYSCHNGGERPKLIPTLDGIYDPPPLPQPDVITRGPASPTADQILDKYLQALGGAQRLAGLTSFVAKGTVQEVGELDTNPMEIYAQAPARLSTIVRTTNGVSTTVCDGNAVWIAAPYEDQPVPLLPLSGLPTQVDYSDYREVAGVKIPFRMMTMWADGRTLTELTEVQPNVPIDSAKFAQPEPAPRPKADER